MDAVVCSRKTIRDEFETVCMHGIDCAVFEVDHEYVGLLETVYVYT